MTYPTSSSASDVWSLRDVYKAEAGGDWPELPAPVDGYIAWYTADSISGTTWTDLSTYSNDATIGGSGYSVTSTTGNGATKTFNVLEGTTNTTVTFPAGILPSTYTFFHVARYNGSSNYRIFQDSTANWLSGFWNGTSGVAFHGAWLNQTGVHGTNWFYSTDQANLYRSNGVERGTISGGSSATNLRVNISAYTEFSDFQIAEILVYNTELSSADYQTTEAYLSAKYGI